MKQNETMKHRCRIESKHLYRNRDTNRMTRSTPSNLYFFSQYS